MIFKSLNYRDKLIHMALGPSQKHVRIKLFNEVVSYIGWKLPDAALAFNYRVDL